MHTFRLSTARIIAALAFIALMIALIVSARGAESGGGAAFGRDDPAGVPAGAFNLTASGAAYPDGRDMRPRPTRAAHELPSRGSAERQPHEYFSTALPARSSSAAGRRTSKTQK